MCFGIAAGQVIRYMKIYFVQKGSEIITPAKGNVNITDRIFHDQCPTNYPGKQFPKTCIGIRISTPGNRHTTCKLRITKSSECTGNACNNEKQYNAGATFKNRFAKGTETSSANDGGNSEESQITNCKHSFQSISMYFRITFFRITKN